MLARYQRIRNDPRHTGCITLISEATAHRSVADWEMAFVPFSKLDRDHRDGFLDLQRFRDTAKMRAVEKDREASTFINAFLASFRYL